MDPSCGRTMNRFPASIPRPSFRASSSTASTAAKIFPRPICGASIRNRARCCGRETTSAWPISSRPRITCSCSRWKANWCWPQPHRSNIASCASESCHGNHAAPCPHSPTADSIAAPVKNCCAWNWPRPSDSQLGPSWCAAPETYGVAEVLSEAVLSTPFSAIRRNLLFNVLENSKTN